MDYTHWFPGEPNDAGNDEDCLLIHDSYPNGEWNDGPRNEDNVSKWSDMSICVLLFQSVS
jgi:hypothetical protein